MGGVLSLPFSGVMYENRSIMLPFSPQPSGGTNKTLQIQPAAPEFSASSAAWTARHGKKTSGKK
jgi:hypothetical protein